MVDLVKVQAQEYIHIYVPLKTQFEVLPMASLILTSHSEYREDSYTITMKAML